MSLLKIALLLSSAVSTHVAGTNPNPTTKDAAEVAKYATHDVSATAAAWVPAITKAVYCLGAIVEAGGVLCSINPSSPISQRLLSPLPSNASFKLSKQYLLGTLLVLVGGYTRYKAYQALGPLFTFELTIREKHSLITSGVYSWVRHPAYSGLILFSIGVSLMTFARGSLVTESGVLKSPVGRAVAYSMLGVLAYVNWKFAGRLAAEDKVLSRHFGPEWDQWASRVPYKLIPGIY